MPEIRFTVAPDVVMPPSKAHAHDAGWDLRAIGRMTIPPGEIRAVPTGVRVHLPRGTYGMICSRSGLVARSGIAVANAPGIIDAGYSGEIIVILINHSAETYQTASGERIAQIVFGRTDLVDVVGGFTLEGDARGDGGLGSSGRH